MLKIHKHQSLHSHSHLTMLTLMPLLILMLILSMVRQRWMMLMKVELRQCQTDHNGHKLILASRCTHLCLEEHQEGQKFKGKEEA